MGLDVFYIGYDDEKPEWGVNSVSPLYLMINKIDGLVEEKNGNKYLNITDTNRNSEILKKNTTKYLMELNFIFKE